MITLKLNHEEGFYTKEDIIEAHEKLISHTENSVAYNEIIERYNELVYEQGYNDTHTAMSMSRNELEDKLDSLKIAVEELLY